MVKRYVPEAGDIVWVDFSPTKGHEQAGTRPAVVITVRPFNEASGLCTVCPTTSRVKGYSNEVPISYKKEAGAVLVDQLKTIDIFARKIIRAGKLSTPELDTIRVRLALVFGIAR